jgi:hypothetical protein
MRMYLIPAAIALSCSFGTLAMAASQHVTGTVKAFDAKARTLTLADGSVYTLAKSIKDPGLKAGEKVNLAWEMSGKTRTAETVTIAK